ncbi:MAG: TonB-dependent receptor [Candidatus Aminicenantes bacterium]|nr:TonB-dependent receptor [Candidatus Aminicenantes bacterium]
MLKPKKGIRETGVFLMSMAFVLAAAAPVLSRAQESKKPAGSIKGRILDYETQKPLMDVSVTIKDSIRKAWSDTTGTYEFLNVPVGYYVLAFELEGYYTDTRTDVVVRPGRATFVNVDLLAVRNLTEEIRVTADYFPKTPDKPGSQMQFNAEELRRDAGSAGDVSRALFDVPGIVKADEEANDLLVRGGSPVENGFYVDNIFIPNINHFPQWGASGGNINMLNMHFIERLDIFTGGFDASYGNRLSSIIDIGYREGNRQSLNGHFNLSIIGIGAQAEGPFAKGKGSFMVSGYRSYLDIIAGLLDTGNPSDYYDIQGKIVYDIDDANRLSLLTINGHSETKEDPEAERASGIGDYSWERFNMSTVGLNWRHLWSNGFSDTSLSYSHMTGRDDTWSVTNNEPLFFVSYRNNWVSLRNVNQLHLGSAHQLKFGVEAQQVSFRSHDFVDDGPISLKGTSGAAFLTYLVYPFYNFSLSAGMRLDYVPLSRHLHLSPRLSFSWVLTKRLSINGAFGMFYQQMPLFLLKQNPENIPLKDMQARHFVLGFKYLLLSDTQLTLEAYDKQYDHFPMSSLAPYYFVIDNINGDNAMFGNWGRLVDEGKGSARGIEFTVQKKLARNLYGLVSLTYFQSHYRDLMGGWHNRLQHNRYIICLSGGYRPNEYWEFNMRWTWMGGKTYTPVDEQRSIQYGYPWIWVDDINTAYMSDYINLSLRAERRFYFNKTNLVVFIGAWNVFDHPNELYRYWDPYGNQYLSDYMWGVIPYIGFEFHF